MNLIQNVFWWDEDKLVAGALVTDGRKEWSADVFTLDELWERFRIADAVETGTRFSFTEDLRKMALVIIEGGEARYTSAQL